MASGLNVVDVDEVAIIRWVAGTDGTNAPTATAEARTAVTACVSFIVVVGFD